MIGKKRIDWRFVAHNVYIYVCMFELTTTYSTSHAEPPTMKMITIAVRNPAPPLSDVSTATLSGVVVSFSKPAVPPQPTTWPPPSLVEPLPPPTELLVVAW